MDKHKKNEMRRADSIAELHALKERIRGREIKCYCGKRQAHKFALE